VAVRNEASKGGKPDKLMRDAIMLALHRTAKGQKTKRLIVIADKLVELAAEGDIQAIKEVCDRVDGKPTQGLDMKHDVGGDLAALLSAFDRKSREERS
jgi:hypothetical protein